MAFEVGVAEFVIFEFSLEKNIPLSLVSKEEGDFRTFVLWVFDFRDILNDLVKWSDACSSSHEVEVVELANGGGVITN